MLTPNDITSRVAIAAAEPMLQSACDYANSRVEDVAGPEWVAGQTLVAEWDFLRRGLGIRFLGLGRVIYFDFVHEVASISKVTVNGAETGASMWNQRGKSGLELRNFNPWNLNVEVEYTPADNNRQRDAVALQVALAYLSFPAIVMPHASGVRVPGTTVNHAYDFSREERRALGRLNNKVAPIRLPDRTTVKTE